MTAPSLVLKCIAATLSASLGSGFSVAVHDGDLGADGKEFVTLKSPGVLVACLGWPKLTDEDSGSAAVLARFVAFCHARLPDAGADAPETGRTSGMVCMDLAHVVTGIVRTSMWPTADDADPPSEPTAGGAAEAIRATNEFTNALAQKGIRVWPVQWLQRVELEPETDAADLNRLAGIDIHIAVVDESNPDDDEFEDDTADESASVDFPEAP